MSDDKQQTPEDLQRFLQEKMGNTIKIDLKAQAQQAEEDRRAEEARREKALDFNYKPREIKEYLDRFVIRQDDAKKVLSTAICDHYHHIQNCKSEEDWRDYKKQNIVLIGPTGVGKTYLIQNIARLIGVPFAKADATKYSETGYVGGDVEDLIRELVAQAGGDIQLAEYGIVYIDEIDKIASSSNTWGKDVSGHGVQRNLLKLMEETEVPRPGSSQVLVKVTRSLISAGSELYRGLGSVVVGGLAVSTIITLVLTPLVFAYAIELKAAVRSLFKIRGDDRANEPQLDS